MTTEQRRLAVLVGGGPAPGINSAISAATIEARNSGFDVIGIFDGYEHLMKGRIDMVRPLTISDVSRIHIQGGSILRTSRANPTRKKEDLERLVESLHRLGVTHMVTIGGDDTSFAAHEVAKTAAGEIRVAHVPKTIDNDLPLPADLPTFGFETARHVGTEQVLNLMEDARTMSRWAFVVVMGRVAGHLALGVGKAAGATLTIVPEEFAQERITLDDVCSIIEGSIIKRRLMGRPHGLVVVAEGIAEKVAPEELAKIPGVEVGYDSYGHINLGDIPLATILKHDVQRRFAARGDKISAMDATLGYGLRSASPIPFDIDYTRTLGYGAIQFLNSESKEERLKFGGMVCLEGGHIRVVPFDDLRDDSTGRVRVRLVDIQSEHYKVAREYMIRLEREDLENPEMRERLAGVAKMSADEFVDTFAGLLEHDNQYVMAGR
jgi:ATP-dependent phosphofructokinase / diphosphate-dependent phosphofructokinase